MPTRTLRIFISSPGDVGQERVLASRVIERLKGEFGGAVNLEPILWEHEPLRATAGFQEQIVVPSETSIVVCILWSRLGTRLPKGFRRKDGSRYESGTEWEFEDAARSFRERGVPDLLVYRKTSEPVVGLSDEDAILGRLRQKKALDTFIKQWFGSAEDSFKAAFNTFETPDEFESLLEEHLRKLIAEHLPERLAEEPGVAAMTWHRGSPFRGLEAFDFEHAPVFFGRTHAVGEVREALVSQAARGSAFLLVFGMSGCGKSSLVRAGVLPTITQPGVVEGVGLWRWCVFRPSAAAGDLFDGLAHALTDAGALPELAKEGAEARRLAELLREAPDQAALPIEMGLKRAAEEVARAERLPTPPEARLAVVVDQLEELFTLEGVDDRLRAGFVRVLSALARSGPVWVICTMRSDFYHRLAELPELVALAEGAGQFHFLPPSPVEIAQMIRNPARAAGLKFEVAAETGERLDDVLHAAAAGDPAALPLLEFTLDELFKERTDDGVLTFAAYERLGGLEGALAQRAEEVFDGLAPAVQAELPSALRALVTVGTGDNEPAVARRVPLEMIASIPECKTLVDAFVDARLLATDRADDGTAVVRVVHEALLYHWPRLRKWLEEDREFLRTRERTANAAAHWREEGESTDLLLPEGKPLAEAEALLTRRDELDPDVLDYIEASLEAFRSQLAEKEAEARRKLRQMRIAAAVFGALAIVATVGGYFGYAGQKEAEAQRLYARSLFLADHSKQQTAAHNTSLGILLALEALPRNMANPDRPYVPQAETALYQALSRYRESLVLKGHTRMVGRAVFSPDSRLIVTASKDKTARVWDATNGDEIAVLSGHENYVWYAEFSPDGRRVVTASKDKTARLWDVQSGAELAVLRGHEKRVLHAAFSPDGGRVITASTDNTARLWDVQNGAELIAVLQEHDDAVVHAAFSPDGHRIVTASNDKTARLWNGMTGAALAVLRGHDDAVKRVAFSPDGRRIVTASTDNTARLWDAATGEELTVLAGHKSDVTHAAFSPDGNLIVTASGDNTARLWDAATGEVLVVLAGHTGDVTHAAFSLDGRLIVTASTDGTTRLWHAKSGTELAVLRGHNNKKVWYAAFSPDGQKFVTASSDMTARLWEMPSSSELAVLQGHEKGVVQAAFSPDGRRVVTASTDNTARLWDAATGEELAVLAGHTGDVTHAAFSPDGKHVVTASWDDTARLWDAATGEELAVLAGHTGDVTHAAFSPDGKRVVTASTDNTARLWDAATGKELAVLSGHEEGVVHAAFSPDGHRVVTASSDHTARLWDVTTGTERAVVLRGHEKSVLHAAFSPDGKRVVTASWDDTARLWDAATGEEIAVLAGHERPVIHAAFSPDGRRVLTVSSDGTQRLWDAASGDEIAVLRGHKKRVGYGVFSPDGRKIVTVSNDRTARLWDSASGVEIAVLRGHEAEVEHAAFSADGRMIVTASADGTARIWPVYAAQELIDYARRTVPRELTAAERKRFFLEAD